MVTTPCFSKCQVNQCPNETHYNNLVSKLYQSWWLDGGKGRTKVNLMEEVDQPVGDGKKWVRNNAFYTKCTSYDKVCKVILNSGSFENMVFLQMAQKLNLKTIPHPNSYQLCVLQRGNEIKDSECCLMTFSIGKNYKNEIWCDVAPWMLTIYYLEDHSFVIKKFFMMFLSIFFW